MSDPIQFGLFDVLAAYDSAGGTLSNGDLYRYLSESRGIPLSAFDETQPVGLAEQPVSLLKRRARWYQQTLKTLGVLEKADTRGLWRRAGRQGDLSENAGEKTVLAFSTRLGIALWGCCESSLKSLSEPVTLCLTSPPYPLRQGRAYGNPNEREYVDFILRCLEPVVKNLTPTGSLVLNISNDIFLPGSPARSLYKERLVLALCDAFGLHKMDELVWHNPSKPPGPVQWASKTRQQLNVAWEPVLWFAPDPQRCKADNRRVLEPHTDAHARFLASGRRDRARHSDGAYARRLSSYPVTEGRIPRNVISLPHNCADQSRYKAAARAEGLPVHGAPYPLALAKFLISFLSEAGDLVVDPMAGSVTTGVAAEGLGRPWICVDKVWEYLMGGRYRFA